MSYLLVIAAVVFLMPSAHAQTTYPSRPIRFIVPFTPGGSGDIFARPIAQKMSESMGQQVVVENRPGSGGVVGTEAAAKAAPDGYTMMMGLTANIAVNPALYAKLPYDPLRDFAPVTLIASAPYVLLVPSSLPAHNVRELIALARAKPGQLAYVSLGSGSMGHLSGEMLASLASVKLLHVPYKSLGQAIPDLISGQVQLLFLGIASAQAQVKSAREASGDSDAPRSYSARNASTGATSVPRRAGTYDATVATRTRTTAVSVNVRGSRDGVS